MELDRAITQNDPEFRSVRSGLLVGDLGGEPEAYLRVVANPFLGFAYLDGWLIVLYEAIFVGFAGALTPMLIVMLIAGLGLVPHLMQYHCLDCGRTERLSRWRRHHCPRPLERRETGRPRRLRGPSPPIQVVLWIWLLMIGAMMLHSWDVLRPG